MRKRLSEFCDRSSGLFMSRRPRWRLAPVAAGLGALGFGASVGIGHQPAEPNEDAPLVASLILEQSHATPGETIYLGFRMRMLDGWHTYWDGLNDTGFAATLKLDLPEGWSAGAMFWPAPERYVTAGGLGLDHVYHDETTLIIPVHVPEDATPGGSVRITGDAEWLVCQDACIPGWATLELEVPVRAEVSTSSSDASLFKATRDRLPIPIERASSEAVSASMDGRELVVRARGASKVAFYPSSRSASPEDIMRGAEARGDALRLAFKSDELEQKPVVGILAVHATDGVVRWYEVKFPVGG